MKSAIVYYSLDGNCDLVAKMINAQTGAQLLRLETTSEKKRSMLGKFFWGGGMVFLKKKPELKPWSFDPESYGLIIIGAPVWAGAPAPPIQSFLDKAHIKGKKIALFACHGGGMGDAMQKLKDLLAGNEIIGEIDFTEPSKGNDDEVKRQVAEWVTTFSALSKGID